MRCGSRVVCVWAVVFENQLIWGSNQLNCIHTFLIAECQYISVAFYVFFGGLPHKNESFVWGEFRRLWAPRSRRIPKYKAETKTLCQSRSLPPFTTKHYKVADVRSFQQEEKGLHPAARVCPVQAIWLGKFACHFSVFASPKPFCLSNWERDLNWILWMPKHSHKLSVRPSSLRAVSRCARLVRCHNISLSC